MTRRMKTGMRTGIKRVKHTDTVTAKFIKSLRIFIMEILRNVGYEDHLLTKTNR